MKHLSLAICACAGVVSFGASWVGDGASHLTPTNAASYDLASNWEGETLPTETTGANFNAAANGTYMRAAGPVAARSILTCDANYNNARDVRIIADAGITGTCPNNQNLLWIGPTLYGNMTANGKLTTWTVTLCGDFVTTFPSASGAQVTIASGTFSHRMDYYANEAGGARTNAFAIKCIYQGSGNILFRAPQSSVTNVTSTWRQTAGSAILFPTDSAKRILPVGTAVTGDGVAAGTFLKRVFPDGSIELSQAIEAGKTAAANAITFAAQRSAVFQRIDDYQFIASSRQMIYVEKTADTDDFTLVFGRMDVHSGLLTFACSAGQKPGRIIIENPNAYITTNILKTCHLQLEGGGLPYAKIRMENAADVARLTVTNGISARAGVFANNIVGTLVKDGTGKLVLPLIVNPESNTGTLRIEEGEVQAVATNGMARLGCLNLKAGAKLSIEGVLAVGEMVVESGATISGPGTLTVPSGTDLRNIQFENGATFRFDTSETMTWSLPATNVVGAPAIWVDAMKTDSMTLEKVGDYTYVRRINDVRGAEYFFATNASTAYSPTYLATGLAEKMPYVRIYGVVGADKTNDTAAACVLVWNREITGIRSVFLMQRISDTDSQAGCNLLGSYKRLGDFARPSGQAYSGPIVWMYSPCAAVLNGVCYQDGVKSAVTGGYTKTQRVSSMAGVNSGDLPTLTELHTVGGSAAADCWGYDQSTCGRGRQEICECIVYTNELTETERLQVAGYLMRKWRHEEPAWTPLAAGVERILPGDGFTLDVDSGKSAAALSVSSGGTFTKTGSGALDLGAYTNETGTLDIRAGTLTLGSGLGADALPGGTMLHVDAAQGVAFTEEANGDRRVSTWTDCDEGAYNLAVYDSQTNYPTLKAVDALGGKDVVDMGPFINANTQFGDYVDISSKKASRALKLKKGETAAEEIGTLRTAFWMMGSANGGGSLLGSGVRSFGSTACGLQRSGGNNYASPLLRVDKEYKPSHIDYFTSSKAVFHVNGEAVSAEEENALSGGWDVVSFASSSPFGLNSIGANHYHWWAGGMALGELVLYYEKLASRTVARAEGYLAQKWFGNAPIEYPQAQANAVNVASGATLRLKGELPLKANILSGGGTIDGNVKLTAAAIFDVSAASMGGLSITGTLDISAGGTVRVGGDEREITPGRYPLITAGVLKGGTWNVSCGPGRVAKLVAEGNALFLDVRERGTVIIVR